MTLAHRPPVQAHSSQHNGDGGQWMPADAFGHPVQCVTLTVRSLLLPRWVATIFP